MLNSRRTLGMIKAIQHGEDPKKTWVMNHWMSAPVTAKDRSILSCIDRHLSRSPDPTDDEIIKAIQLYARI